VQAGRDAAQRLQRCGKPLLADIAVDIGVERELMLGA